ncbi:RNA-directed DNA polymerase [Arcobacter caeni]|uniref:Reverse transcriptase domain-containing protein n=1 Tax=Arcobacter caeni TaxID=1912877 RepID=A0A363D297_9BACT|nr:RNA-directed DNA polymerase [Arcobacter caeni]PUE65476.1 hypothetical protein B0174_03915 [Arcobacter caeni]
MNKKSIISEIVEVENLHWAWTKAKAFFAKNEYWYDQIAISNFSANYENELKQIQTDIMRNKYKLEPIRPIFFPKGLDEQGKPRNRQMFLINVRDQVVWLAVMNIIGKYYDKLMPFWSYGNRLYISMFPDGRTQTGKIKWGYGNYRNTTTNTYRNFQQSWPRFRKDIHLISKLMPKKKITLDLVESEDVENNSNLKELHKIKYKEKSYWSKNESDSLYWASIDLTKFFPKSNTDAIKKNFTDFADEIKEKYTDFSRLQELIDNLLAFEVDYDGLTATDDDYKAIGLNTKSKFTGIPTALFSAGFLSNIAMLKVDKISQEILEKRKEIAHFRFVDDHTFLSTNADALLGWIEEYEKILQEHFTDASGSSCMEINHSKTLPKECAIYIAKKNGNLKKLAKDLALDCQKYELKSLKEIKENTLSEMFIDPLYPSTLMNHTLEKMSMINNTPFDLLDSDEGSRVIHDLEHLLVSEFSDEEIRGDTRMAYASSRLAQYTARKDHDFTSIYLAKSKLLKHSQKRTCEEKCEEEKEIKDLSEDKKNSRITNYKKEKEKLEDSLIKAKEKLETMIQQERRRIFNLLIYTIRSHPDKLSLWKNTILFCEKNGFSEMTSNEIYYKNELHELWDLIQELKNKNHFNQFSYIYIMTFFYDQLANSINRSFVMLSSNPSYREMYRKCTYLNAIFKYDFFERLLSIKDETYYFKQSQNLLKTTISSIIHLTSDLKTEIKEKIKINTTLFENLNIFDWNKNTIENVQFQELDYDMVIWNISEKFMKTSVDISAIIKTYYKSSTFNNYLSYSIMSLFPKLLNKETVIKLLTKEEIIYFPFSWWYEVLKENFITYEKLKNITNKSALECFEYISITKDKDLLLNLLSFSHNKNNRELFGLKIILLLINNWSKEVDLFTFDQINKRGDSFPYNFIFTVDKDKKYKIDEINLPNRIIDERYFPNFINFDGRDNPEKMFIFGLGILLYQLITQTKELPNYMYLPSQQLLNISKFLSDIEKHPISSLTTEIINSCLSKRNRENQKFIERGEDKPEDTKYEFEVKNISQLKLIVIQAIKSIESGKYQFDDNIRYLIPFSLQKLKADILINKEDR